MYCDTNIKYSVTRYYMYNMLYYMFVYKEALKESTLDMRTQIMTIA